MALPARGKLAPDGQAPLRITVISPGLPSGFARGVVRISSTAGVTDIPVSIANPTASRQLRLEPDGTLVGARQGNGASRGNRSFVVLNQGNVPLD